MATMTELCIDRLNYYNDPRTQGPSQLPVLYLEDGTEKALPTRWEVCPVCDGEGNHVNPSIDAGGLSSEQFAEDPDFLEAYMRGTYNVTCYHCGGRTTVQSVDWDALSAEDREAYEAQLEAEQEDRAVQRAELAHGC